MWLNCQLSSWFTLMGLGDGEREKEREEGMSEGGRGEGKFQMSRKHLQRIRRVPLPALPSCFPITVCQGAGITGLYFGQTRLLLTENWNLLFLRCKQWDTDGFRVSNTEYKWLFSWEHGGSVCVCHRPDAVAQHSPVCVAAGDIYYYYFDNTYTWKHEKCLTWWDWGLKSIASTLFTCQSLHAAHLIPFQSANQTTSPKLVLLDL